MVRFGDHAGRAGEYLGLVVDVDECGRNVLVARPFSPRASLGSVPVGVVVNEAWFPAAFLEQMPPPAEEVFA